MRKIELPFKILFFLALFLIYSLFEISHAVTKLLEDKPGSKTGQMPKPTGKDDRENNGFKLETLYISRDIKDFAWGFGLVYTSF